MGSTPRLSICCDRLPLGLLLVFHRESIPRSCHFQQEGPALDLLLGLRKPEALFRVPAVLTTLLSGIGLFSPVQGKQHMFAFATMSALAEAEMPPF